MSEENPTFVRVARLSDVLHGRGRSVRAGLREIALLNGAGRIHAVDGACPHMRGPLADGRISGAVVACPWHGWKFDVVTGACLDLAHPWARLRVHRVRVEGEEILVAPVVPERKPRPVGDRPVLEF